MPSLRNGDRLTQKEFHRRYVAYPEDVMGYPGSGPVLRRHFEKLIGSGLPARSGP